jgi:TolB-like protein
MNMRTKLFTLVLTALISLPAQSQTNMTLAIFPFTWVSEQEGDAIVSQLTRQAILRNAFEKTTLITENTIKTIHFESQFQRNSGLTDADSIFELGKQLNAGYVVSGYITKFGDRNLIIVSILNVQSLQLIAGDYLTYSRLEELYAMMPEIAKHLAEAVPRDTSKLAGLSVPPLKLLGDADANDAQVLAQILAINTANGGEKEGICNDNGE